MRKPLTAAVLGAAIAGLAIACSLAAQDGGRTVRDRVYSQAQAARGERLFESICMNCHEIAEFTAAGAYLEDVALTIHAHPTLPEAFMEACKVALGEPIHMLKPPERKKRGEQAAPARA